MTDMSHADKVAFFDAAPHPRVQHGGGLQVPVLQMGGGVAGLGRVAGSDHRVIGYPGGLQVPTQAGLPANLAPDQEALTRQELVKQRLDILGSGRPEL